MHLLPQHLQMLAMVKALSSQRREASISQTDKLQAQLCLTELQGLKVTHIASALGITPSEAVGLRYSLLPSGMKMENHA